MKRISINFFTTKLLLCAIIILLLTNCKKDVNKYEWENQYVGNFEFTSYITSATFSHGTHETYYDTTTTIYQGYIKINQENGNLIIIYPSANNSTDYDEFQVDNNGNMTYPFQNYDFSFYGGLITKNELTYSYAFSAFPGNSSNGSVKGIRK